MTTQTYNEVLSDEVYNKGWNAAEKTFKKRMLSVRERVGNVLQILLSAGTSEEDDTIIELQKAFNELKPNS